MKIPLNIKGEIQVSQEISIPTAEANQGLAGAAKRRSVNQDCAVR